MYSDRTGMDKNHPGQNLPDKRPPDKKPREQLRQNLYKGALSGFFVLGLLKIGGPRCVTYFFGGSPGMCDEVRQGGGGSKLAKNSVTYFMDGPQWGLGQSSRQRDE